MSQTHISKGRMPARIRLSTLSMPRRPPGHETLLSIACSYSQSQREIALFFARHDHRAVWPEVRRGHRPLVPVQEGHRHLGGRPARRARHQADVQECQDRRRVADAADQLA